MALFTERERPAYAQASMPQPAFARGPWGEAIRYWLQQKNMSPADLARATKIRPNTISRARRGFHTTTRVLERIATAFKEPIEVVLVSPTWYQARVDQRRIIQEAVEAALRTTEASRPSASPDAAVFETMEKATQKLEAAVPHVGQRPTRMRKGKKPKSFGHTKR